MSVTVSTILHVPQVQDTLRAAEDRYTRYADTARYQIQKAISRHGKSLSGKLLSSLSV
jgi:hypothetical protein